MPVGMPVSMANANAPALNCKVAGSRSRTYSRAGRWARIDIPKSPRTALARNRANCSDVACSPRMIVAGSPGVMCNSMKTTKVTSRMSKSDCRLRHTRYSIVMTMGHLHQVCLSQNQPLVRPRLEAVQTLVDGVQVWLQMQEDPWAFIPDL